MNLLKRMALRWAVKGVDLTLTGPAAANWRLLGLGSPNWSGVAVNEMTQLQISAAFSAIRLIAETVGTLPLHLFRKTAKGRERAVDDARYNLVRNQPNEYMTATEWKEAVAVSICTVGQAYNYTNRFESTGRVVSIEPVHKSRVTPEILPTGEVIYWLTNRSGQRVRLTRKDVLPIRGFGGVGELEGYAPHHLHANTYGLTRALEKYGAQFFSSGGRPLGVLTTSHEFRAEDRAQIRESFNNYVKSSLESGLLPLLEGGVTYSPVTTPNNDAQFIETRKLQIAEMARIYRVPLHMLMEMDKASYANTEQANKHFLDYTLMPYLVRIEQALNSCLLSDAERKTLYFEFDVTALLRGDTTQRSEYYSKMRLAGAMSQNEIRERENMDTRDGADDLLAPLNMAPSDMLREILVDSRSGSAPGA